MQPTRFQYHRAPDTSAGHEEHHSQELLGDALMRAGADRTGARHALALATFHRVIMSVAHISTERLGTMWRMPIFLAASTVLLGCSGEPRTAGPPAQLLERVGRGEFILYRLNGDHYPSEPIPDGADLLHGWEILQTCSIASAGDRAQLIQALEAGQADARRNPKPSVDCFNPRHAIRTIDGETTTDQLICFECRNIMVWTNGEMTGGSATSAGPQAVFDSFLEQGDPRR